MFERIIEMNIKKKIAWITADYYADTDLNYEVMSIISNYYEIYWIIIEGKNQYFNHDAYDKVAKLPNIHLNFMKNNYRMRDFRSLFFYFKVLSAVKKYNVDLVYYNVAPNPASAFMTLFLNKNKTIFTAHDGKAQNDSSSFGLMRTMSYNVTYRFARNVCMFSKAQAELMQQTYGEKNIFIMTLPLKDFGKSNQSKPDGFVRFLSFGHIIYQKNIDLLIEAGNILYERGIREFKISINGFCDDWKFYQNKIKYPEIFECSPDFVPNEKLLDLFASSHYAVFPYRRVSQSGVLKLAFNYRLPVVVSNIGSFKEEVVEGENGFFFKVGDAESLADVMEHLLVSHKENYSKLLDRMNSYIEAKYSDKKSADSYIDLFNQIIVK